MPRVILGVKLYSLKETAELLGVTTPSVSKYIKNDLLTATTIGGCKYVSEENLMSFLKKTE